MTTATQTTETEGGHLLDQEDAIVTGTSATVWICSMRNFMLMLLLMTGVGFAQPQQIYTGVIKDLSGSAVTSGQVTFTLAPPTDSTIPGVGRFTPTTVPCNINADGTLSGYVAGVVSGACTVTANISLSPAGTSYRVCEQPYFATPGSCFYDFALGGTKDISSVAPTLLTGPINYGGVPGPVGPQGPGGIGCGAANCIIQAPAGGQAVTQVSGSTLGVNSLESVLYADQFTGADAGAKINAADTRLGSNPGTIIYSSPSSATATTNVVLSANHKLILQSPISWTATITLPTSSSGQDISCPALQTLAYTAADTSWIIGTSNSNVSFHDCRFAGTLTSGKITRGILLTAANGVSVVNNTVSEALLAGFTSSAAYTTCADGSQCQYPNVNIGNSSSNIKVYGNKGSATGTGIGAFLFLYYVNNASVIGNVASGYFDAVMFWGGDSCFSGCTAGQNGDLTNDRKAKNLTISDNAFTGSLNSCIWGSMGQFVTVSGNACTGNDTTTDVGIDFEGSFDSIASNNAVFGYDFGNLATYWFSTRVSFIGNAASQDNASHLMISTNNASGIPNGLTQTFAGNTLNCTAASVCAAQLQSAETYTIANNVTRNVRYDITGTNIAQIAFTGNTLAFDVSSTHGVEAITSIGSPLSTNGSILYRNNTVLSSVTQSAGTQAFFALGADGNSLSNIRIEGNITGGTHAFPVGIECDAGSSNAGVPTNCTLLNNNNAGTVVTSNGSSGAPVKVNSINTMQAVSASGCTITAGAIGNNCQAQVTFAIPQPDTSYQVVGCTFAPPSGVVSTGNVSTKTTTSFFIGEVAMTTATTGGGTVNCLVVHP
jgi:hypothetical protein